jgi:putative transposase
MSENTPSPLSNVITIDDDRIKSHLDRIVRGSVEETLNALLDAEADRLCNAQRYERSEARRDTRAGHYERKLHTKAGEVQLKVPKLRRQTFEMAIIERYRRRESSVEEALIEMYLAEVSVRRVEDITEALWGMRVSPATVSDRNKKIYGAIEGWRNRPIEAEHPYVFLDGIVLKRSWAGEVRNVSLLVAIGVNSQGFREILGICEGAKEDKAGWSAFLKHLKGRGLKGVRLIISDTCLGLAESAAEFFPEAGWQRCVVHWYRHLFSHVPSTKVREVAAMLKAIHASEDVAAAREKALQVIAKVRASRLTTAAELAAATFEETLSYYSFPEEHWRRIRKNNPLERVLREIRRRTRGGRRLPGRPIGSQPGRSTLAAHRRDRLVDQEILEHRAAEGPADERCHYGLSQSRASPAQIKVRKILDTTRRQGRRRSSLDPGRPGAATG